MHDNQKCSMNKVCVCTLELFILQAKESTERAISICQRVGKPNEADRKLLNKLYQELIREGASNCAERHLNLSN